MSWKWIEGKGDWVIDMTLLGSGALSIAFAVTIGLLALVR
ncbi:hypothetical protein GGR33_003666 [Methylobacterium brachythecii]|uniref:Uncharacterized protein n=1 Tax=Methylobacterium brachythecii TaxID=1176177 RepID=A0A7W6AIV2_9HYPH|nr:hypothetical protein [Methylobacterium brachythecii]